MRQYTVEALVFFPKLTGDNEHGISTSQADIQRLLDDDASRGWRLVSTHATDWGSAD